MRPRWKNTPLLTSLCQRRPMTLLLIYIVVFFVANPASHAQSTFTGKFAIEWTGFGHKGNNPEQMRHGTSLELSPEYYHPWNNNKDSITIQPFLRLDQHDATRNHVDLRELLWIHVSDNWESKVGITRIFWGTTEFLHLVDVINQTDAVEGVDGEDKLGQAMINVSWVRNWGIVDAFVLPGFRRRTFPGREGRLRTPLPVDAREATYESSAGSQHIDFAIRYSHSIGDYDFGLSTFRGTDRDPIFRTAGPTADTLSPFYAQMTQLVFDGQATKGDFLFKAEAIVRHRLHEKFTAASLGLEYTQIGIFESAHDLSYLAEWLFDDRADRAPTPFENDIFLGLRWVFNDAPSTEILAGLVQAVESRSNLLSLELQRRLNDHVKLSIEGRLFMQASPNDPISTFRDEDFLRLEIAYYW